MAMSATPRRAQPFHPTLSAVNLGFVNVKFAFVNIYQRLLVLALLGTIRGSCGRQNQLPLRLRGVDFLQTCPTLYHWHRIFQHTTDDSII